MYKATRLFISERQKFCQSKLKVVTPRKIGGGKINDCSNNAMDATEKAEYVRSVTGWIVSPYNPLNDRTEIIQHWWNKDNSGNYFDTTPGVDDDCEYVEDMDLIYYLSKNFDSIENNVAMSLVLSNGNFIGVDEDSSSLNGFKIIKISSLANEVLYRQKG